MTDMDITGTSFIAGAPAGSGSHTFRASNPRQRTRIDPAFAEATTDEIDRAARAARAAFEQTRNFSADRLADFLDRVANEIEALGDLLIETTDAETALGRPRLEGERARTTGQLRKFGDLLREGSYVEAIINTEHPDAHPSIRRMLVPMGPVAVFSASNFPYAFAVAGGDTASAFAAGCPVIVKGHPAHPATSELFARAINTAVEKADFPAGFFSLIQGETIETGQTLVKHPDIAAVGFTGSLRAGRAIYDAAAARPEPIPVYAEMGSINPVVLLPGAVAARGDEIANGLLNSVTLGSGQFCTNPGLVLLQNTPETHSFIDTFAKKMQAARPGVLLNENIQTGLDEAVKATTKQSGVETLTGGQAVEAEYYCYAHTVFKTTSEVLRSNPDLQREHFGPVTMFVLCQSHEDMLATIEALHGNLSGTVHAEPGEQEEAAEVFSVLREKVGRLIWNGFPTGVAVVYAMQHGGPYPATTTPRTTSVGMTAIKRFMRPVAYQNLPDSLLPPALQDENLLNIWRIVDDEVTKAPI